jgi:hypothetical protein
LCAPSSHAKAGGLVILQALLGVHHLALSSLSQMEHDTSAVHVPLLHSPSPRITTLVTNSKRAEDTSHANSDMSMADLNLVYNHGTDASWSLFSRTRRIISKKSLGSSDMTDWGNDLSSPYFGIFRLESHWFHSMESTVLEMQRLLTSVFSLHEDFNQVCLVSAMASGLAKQQVTW